ncbi:MAG: hypothetical protein A2W23_07130 [Planctomycetes bacterium RBG_16_43_13]|nr:MAG: hypothetical protein A2W23_07130 [Planctomycetes bacterium RBG_16_43_13]
MNSAYKGDVAIYDSAKDVLTDYDIIKSAIADYDKVIELNPANSAAYYNRASARQLIGDGEGARADYDRSGEISREESLRENGGMSRDGLDLDRELTIYRLRREIAELDKVIEKDPKDMNALYLRGNAKRGLGDRKGAIADYDKAIKGMERIYIAAHAPKPVPDNVPSYSIAEIYNARGLAKDKLFDHKGAIADFDEAIKMNQKYVEAYRNRAFANVMLHKYDDAVDDYDNIIVLNPEDARAYVSRGNTKCRGGDYKGARVDWEKAIGINASLEYVLRPLIRAMWGK